VLLLKFYIFAQLPMSKNRKKYVPVIQCWHEQMVCGKNYSIFIWQYIQNPSKSPHHFLCTYRGKSTIHSRHNNHYIPLSQVLQTYISILLTINCTGISKVQYTHICTIQFVNSWSFKAYTVRVPSIINNYWQIVPVLMISR
jgi:hypothetical protein